MAALPPSPNPQMYGPSDPADDPNRKQAEATLGKLAAKLIAPKANPNGAPPAPPQPAQQNQSQPAPQTGNTPPSSQPAAPPVDPIIAQLTSQLTKDNARADADQTAADNMQVGPSAQYNSPTFQQPNKTQAIIATALSLLFPGSKIGNFASHYGQGMEQGAEDRYKRAEDDAKQQYQVAEQTREDQIKNKEMAQQKVAGDEGIIARADTALNQRQNQLDRDALTAQAQAHKAAEDKVKDALARDKANETRRVDSQKIIQSRATISLGLKKYGLDEKKFAQTVKYDDQKTAVALNGQMIRYDTAQQEMGLRAKIAVLSQQSATMRTQMTQQGANGRAILNNDARQIASKAGIIKADMSKQLDAIYKNQDMSDDQKQQAAAGVVDNATKQFDALTAPLLDPEFYAGDPFPLYARLRTQPSPITTRAFLRIKNPWMNSERSLS